MHSLTDTRAMHSLSDTRAMHSLTGRGGPPVGRDSSPLAGSERTKSSRWARPAIARGTRDRVLLDRRSVRRPDSLRIGRGKSRNRLSSAHSRSRLAREPNTAGSSAR